MTEEEKYQEQARRVKQKARDLRWKVNYNMGSYSLSINGDMATIGIYDSLDAVEKELDAEPARRKEREKRINKYEAEAKLFNEA